MAVSPRPLCTASLLALLLAACSTQRALWIESDPPGAQVWVNGEPRGPAPVRVDFVHYGVFDVRLEKEGYEAVASEVEVPTQVDGYPIVDLPFEFVVRERHFVWKGTLTRIPSQPTEADLRAVLQEARTFRARAREETGPGATPPRRRPLPEPPPLHPGGFPGR